MSSLVDYLDKGATLGRDAPCLSEGDDTLSYAEVQDLSWRVAGALKASGVAPGDKVGILSSNNARAFACVFGIARLGAVWCPINPRNETAENRALLELFDCDCVIYHPAYAEMVGQIPLRVTVSLDDLPRWLEEQDAVEQTDPPDDLAMLVGTGGTTGLPKGVMLTARNLETMTALTLMGYPFTGRPAYLALAPLTHAAGVLCFPVLSLGGRIVVMPKPDLGAFLQLVERHRITHTFLPPTLIYMLLGHDDIATTDLSLTAVLLVRRGADVDGQARGSARNDRPDGAALRPERGADDGLDALALGALQPGRNGRAATAGVSGQASPAGPGPDHGRTRQPAPTGERGEIVVRSSLVMAGYYKDPEATKQASRTAGTTPATSATSTTTATCSSSTA